MTLMRRLTLGGTLLWLGLAVLAATTWLMVVPTTSTSASSLELPAHVETVYGAVTDGRGPGARWGPGFEDLSHETTPWTSGVPTTAVQGASRHAHQVRTADRPRTFVTEFVETSGITGTSTWTFESLGETTTRVTVVQDARVQHPLRRALYILRRGGQADIRGQLRALERAIPGGDQS